jgi:predicted deacylase
MVKRAPFEIAGRKVAAGERVTIDLPVGSFTNHMPATMPVRVLHGRKDGPVMFVSAAVHGDEVIGVEIIRRLLRSRAISRIRGTLICIPVVNTFGFVGGQRYLPDRRDLNRSFPGGPNGSLAGQLAHLFTREIVDRSDFGIDLHSAASHRTNLPQIRFSSGNPATREAANVFGAPIVIEAPLREGSLRATAQDRGIDMLLYEAGEALRFDEFCVRVGLKGILNVLKLKEMIVGRSIGAPKRPPVWVTSSRWVRSPVGGVFRAMSATGDRVMKDDVLGYVSDPFGDTDQAVLSSDNGVIIGRTNLPFVNPGDALFHIAQVRGFKTAEEKMGAIEQDISSDRMFDEDEII